MPIRAPFTARPPLAAALLLAGLMTASMAAAQEAEPEAAPAAEERPKPKPKPAPRPKPAPAKPAEKAAEKPADAKSAEAKPAEKAAWPAGADTVTETYGEWTTSCARTEAQVACMVMQTQGDRNTGRRQFAFELRTPRDGRAEGVILMPFGLAIEPGVSFKLDEATLGKGAFYISCTAEGCLVPVSFPTLATDSMKTAKTLVVTGKKAANDEAVTISLPLAGFATAFERAAALGS
ncbi:invasion associated locus B family protein [Methylobacterium dankookense]|uniref:Invasion protein B n=1 Tax=Methylobacterium dankookense TaxID=560405 RepID=A0A564G4G7_9HYPH|nr:invasion associated locus B family protein [Methylobacterium dankookense]GJD57600.1 hypothetical protein IFDJLNFL_3504 [Methylobacterium dankookense]VUF15379.1 hypothetical protein MTDSW087_05119 [Methylobacterium dankookense]